MAHPPIGIWIVGARGGVAATAALGVSLLARKQIEPLALLTAQPQFDQLDLVNWNDLVIGGHEIRSGSVAETAAGLLHQIGGMDQSLVEASRDDLDDVDRRIRRGTLAGCNHTIQNLAGESLDEFSGESQRDTIHRLQDDFRSFQAEIGAQRVIVVNLASTEPTAETANLPGTWEGLDRLLDASSPVLPASCLYAIAALDLGLPYINFTPSDGASQPAICELAELRGTCHAGRDGKTGETLLKSVLAPMFAARNLQVMSWVGHNIFGNMDAQVLDDPVNKSSKIESKDRLLGEILGYRPQTLVTIERINSMGDWKTAWDHIHFRGFLGTPMTMQFTWQGCDSILAAPLVLDLVRLVDLACKRGEKGVLSSLACFFKSPLGAQEHDFFRQLAMLDRWLDSTSAGCSEAATGRDST